MTSKRFLFALMAILSTICANAFWSRSSLPSFQIHQDITKQALKNKNAGYAFGGSNYTFTDDAVTSINEAHKLQDGDLSSYDPRDHFDSESFNLNNNLLFNGNENHISESAINLLQNERLQLQKVLSQGAPFDQTTMWRLLGRMLHMIQDFYAHSNYVTAFSVIAPFDFGRLTASGNAVAPANWGGGLVQTCQGDRATLLSGLAIVTTGYYPPNPALSGKCNHGWESIYTVGAECAVGVRSSPDGIARDSPCFSALADNRLYFARRDLAEQETELFVKSITDVLNAAGNSAGFCALLGLKASGPPCNSVSGSVNIYTFYSGVASSNGVPNTGTQTNGCGDLSTPQTTSYPEVDFSNDDGSPYEFRACMVAGQWIPKSHSWSYTNSNPTFIVGPEPITLTGVTTTYGGTVSIDSSGALSAQDSGTWHQVAGDFVSLQNFNDSITIMQPTDPQAAYSGSFSSGDVGQETNAFTPTEVCKDTWSDSASGTDVPNFLTPQTPGVIQGPGLVDIVNVPVGGSLPADCIDTGVSPGASQQSNRMRRAPRVLTQLIRARHELAGGAGATKSPSR